MDIKRIVTHLLATPAQVKRAFPSATLIAIEKAIKASETSHSGEVRFAVDGALDGRPLFAGQSARERAIEVFSLLRVWDTERNNGVLIYLLLADRDVEIVADRGIHAKVGTEEWEKICRTMESGFRQADYEGGVVRGIEAVTRHLVQHFPAAAGDRNELADKPMML